MELRHLRHFVVVAEELHFGRAAERLGMEQSPLSHSIRNLEADLRVTLFHRTTRRTWLTRVGTRFYPEAKRILQDMDAATASLRNEDREEPAELRLALGEDLAAESFTRFLFELEHHRPPLAIEVRELMHADAVRLVRDGVSDLALTLDGRALGGLRQVKAWGEPLVLVVAINHPLAERDQVSLAEIVAEPLALPRLDICPGYLNQIEGLFTAHNLVPANRVAVRHWNTAVSFAATGRAVALCPGSIVAGATGAAVVPVQGEAELVTWMLYPEGEPSAAVSLALEVASLVSADTRSRVVSEGGA